MGLVIWCLLNKNFGVFVLEWNVGRVWIEVEGSNLMGVIVYEDECGLLWKRFELKFEGGVGDI